MEKMKLKCDTPPLHDSYSWILGQTVPWKHQESKVTHLKDFLRYILMKYYSYSQMPKD